MTNVETPLGAAETPSPGVPPSVISIVLWNDGRRQSLQADVGGALVWVLKQAGVPLPAVCGGKGVCGTCRIWLTREWLDKLPAPQKREHRLLTHLGADSGERLSCQITLTAELDGIEVRAHTIHPERDEKKS